MSHEFPLPVYYEDTDAAGIVYYANYLKFIERARSEALLAAGFSQVGFLESTGMVFAVRAVSGEYLIPARLEDNLVVRTEVARIGGASIDMNQGVWRGEELLSRFTVTIVVLAGNGRPRRVPDDLRAALAPLAN